MWTLRASPHSSQQASARSVQPGRLWRGSSPASHKRREAGQDALITSLKEQIADLKALVATLRRNASMMRRTAGKWRDQLIAHDIDPDPSDWPEDTE